VLSAINRNVSNADPQHVFPGYSKRLRQIDTERGRQIDVFETFSAALKKRCDYLREMYRYWHNGSRATVLLDHAESSPIAEGSVDLIVTNPPYISSVRYLETLKLEMSWAGFIDNADTYRHLDRQQYGTERFGSAETGSFLITGIRKVDMISRTLFERGQAKMSLTVSTYFRRLCAALEAWDRMLRPGGVIVLKMSPSRIRNEVVPTPEIIVELLRRKSYQLMEQFTDDYNPNSRSLLTARNYYSGRMDSDVILVMVKP
jgi:methylase of polypeptide subunit release factors